jgi:nucleoid-associated protein YgaU
VGWYKRASMSEQFETGEGLVVRPVAREERARFDAELAAHHWLGARLVGEVMRYVAVDAEGRWLAVAGFGAAARACGVRDRWVGWDRQQ